MTLIALFYVCVEYLSLYALVSCVVCITVIVTLSLQTCMY